MGELRFSSTHDVSTQIGLRGPGDAKVNSIDVRRCTCECGLSVEDLHRWLGEGPGHYCQAPKIVLLRDHVFVSGQQDRGPLAETPLTSA